MDAASAILLLIALIAAGAAIFFLVQWKRAGEENVQAQTQLEAEQQRSGELKQTLDKIESEKQKFSDELSSAKAHQARLEQQLKSEQEKAEEKLQSLNAAKEEMKSQFKSLAQDILDEKKKKFDEDSGKLLKPLTDNLDSFRKRLEEMQKDNIAERSALQTNIKSLQEGALQISADASNLTQALKGDSKKQGDWGEMILETLLDNSGLLKDEHYKVQTSYRDEDSGARQMPDVIVKLPEGKHLIIDAKVSLVAYNEYHSAETEEQRTIALKRHIQSVQKHIDDLHKRNYSAVKEVNSPDFVLMFMAIEPAYILVLREDMGMCQRALEDKVALVGPTTLMPTLRTVAHLWRMDKQQKEAADIASRGEKICDKIAGINEDMEKLGRALTTTMNTYNDARGKISEGRGSLLSQAQTLTKLGIKSSKKLPAINETLED